MHPDHCHVDCEHRPRYRLRYRHCRRHAHLPAHGLGPCHGIRHRHARPRDYRRGHREAWLYRWPFAWSRPRLYFKLSPLGTTTAAIIDNSTPTVWDLAVALAGGFLRVAWATRATRNPPRSSPAWLWRLRSCRPCARRAMASPSQAGRCFSRRFMSLASTWSLSHWPPKPYCFFLRVPLKRDLNGGGIVTAEENAEVKELSRKVRRRIIVGTVVFAIPCIVMTAGVYWLGAGRRAGRLRRHRNHARACGGAARL